MALPTAAASAASAGALVAPHFGTSAASQAAPVATSPDASAVDLAAMMTPFTPDAFANGFATLVGALIGAMLAYALQRRFQRSLEHKGALIAAHRLMFSLLQQINTIVLIQRDYVHTELSNPGRFLSIPATPAFNTGKNVLQLAELAFLLEEREGRAILYEFYIAQENYVEALNQWNMRSILHFDKVQPALAASGIVSGSAVTMEMFQKALGAHTFGSIVNSTNNCIETLRRAFEKLLAAKIKARAYVVRRFKTDDFTDFDFPDTYGLASKDANPPNAAK